MRPERISPATEILLMQVAEKHYPRTRFRVFERPQFTVDRWVEIDFWAYLSENATDRPYKDPFHKYYRRDKLDFNVSYSLMDNYLLLSSEWRELTLTLRYTPTKLSWWDEGDEIPRPSPHGDKLEAVAKDMYPILMPNNNPGTVQQ